MATQTISKLPEIDLDRLERLAAEKAPEYAAAHPFPHIVIDDFVDPDLLEQVRQEVEDEGGLLWDAMQDRFQQKFACNSTRLMGPRTRSLINFLNGQELIDFLEKLTGMDGLVPDPTLAGGGIHALRPGGYLNVHADFNFHKKLKLDRRINLLLYLNHDWKEEYGGQLELWDESMTRCERSVVPLFNRCVIFSTTDRSFHGNPNPVAAPDGRTRKSLAFYYYSNGRPADEVSDPHETKFKHRPGEETALDRSRSWVRQVVPPIIMDLFVPRR